MSCEAARSFGPSAPWGRRPLASLKPPYRLPVQGQAGWGFPPLQGCRNAVVTLQLPTQSWLYDPTNANLCYLSFQYHDFIPYANLCQSLNLICTSTYQGLDSGRPDSYPAVYKKHGFLDTLTFLLHPFFLKKISSVVLKHFCFTLFFEKKISRILFWWFWIIFFFCKKNKSWEFGIISRGFFNQKKKKLDKTSSTEASHWVG